jgi:hypothetical protein
VRGNGVPYGVFLRLIPGREKEREVLESYNVGVGIVKCRNDTQLSEDQKYDRTEIYNKDTSVTIG